MNNAFLESGAIMSLGSDRIAIGSGTRSWMSQHASKNQFSFYFPDFFFKEPPHWFTHKDTTEITIEQLIKKLPSTSLQKPIFKWQNNFKPLFEKTFHDLQHRFATKQLQKAVPFVFESTQQIMTPDIFIWALSHILKYAQNKNVHLYGFWDSQKGILGATPELLFTLNNEKHLQTMACAGTARNSKQLERLLNDPKEQQEHQLVVDGIVESLAPFGNLEIGSRQVLNLPGLSHLLTPINVTLNDNANFDSLVLVLHPTPALGAYPRDSGIRWLREFQTKINRKRFGAPVGYFNPSNDISNCYVAIRNIQWDADGIVIGAGCGVIPSSNLEQEWEEIQAKIQAIKNMMQL